MPVVGMAKITMLLCGIDGDRCGGDVPAAVLVMIVMRVVWIMRVSMRLRCGAPGECTHCAMTNCEASGIPAYNTCVLL